MNRSINPFYIRKPSMLPAVAQPRPGPRFARLPLAPVNGSPVPHLTSRKVYRSSFIPGLHDVCMIFEKQP